MGQRYLALLKNLEEDRVFKRDHSVKWKRRNRGYIHNGAEALECCPVYGHPQSYCEIMAGNY